MVLSLVALQSVINCANVYGVSSILRVVPPPIEIKAGQEFTVSIDICDVVDMAAYEFKVSWDTEFANYVSHTHTPPWWWIIGDPIIGEGYIELAATTLAPPFFTGSATLATVTLTGMQSGDTYIHLSEVYFADDNASPIPVVTEDAAITILPPEHDISVTGISPKRIIGQGYSADICVAAVNQGDYDETFNTTLHANATFIGQQTIHLTNGTSTTLNFTWSTIGCVMGNYSIWAYAAPVAGETYVDDNTFIGGWVVVTIPGDVDGDRHVDIFDMVKIAQVYGTVEGELMYTSRCDIDDDADIDLFDLVIAAGCYGQSW
jgi:hypothetical protein